MARLEVNRLFSSSFELPARSFFYEEFRLAFHSSACWRQALAARLCNAMG